MLSSWVGWKELPKEVPRGLIEEIPIKPRHSLNLTKTAGIDLIKLFPVSKHSFNDGWLLMLAGASRTGRIFIEGVADVSLMTGRCGSTVLKRLDWTQIQREFEINQIRWKFNPPFAPWWGGFWERLIGIVKDHLRKNLRRSTVPYEEFCECESVMNRRPLTYLSEEPDLKVLTPSSFLQDLPNNDVPNLDEIGKTNINKRYRYVQRLRQILNEIFRNEYLGFLRSSIPKRLDHIDIVLIGRED
ncbi:bel12-ag transposon polyprotein [Trichonephila clavipes]|nr:bel12-ag transposon polyprotein [Trichonephila clavipes]